VIPGPAWPHHVANDSSWFGRWRLAANAERLQDRPRLQRKRSYSASTASICRQAMTESMAHRRHTLEHLASAT